MQTRLAKNMRNNQNINSAGMDKVANEYQDVLNDFAENLDQCECGAQEQYISECNQLHNNINNDK